MKHPSLLLTAALSLAAASAYAQAAKSSPAAGASASPSTPPTIASAIDREISIIEKELVEAATAPDVKAKFEAVGFDVVANNGEQFAAFLKDETERWRDVIQKGNITPGQ